MMAAPRLRSAFRAAVRSLRAGDDPGLPQAAARPILLVHGFASSSQVMIPLERYLQRTWKRPVMRLRLGRRLPLHLQDVRASAREVHAAVERLAAAQGFEYVDVVGHSLGGLVATYALKRFDRGRYIRRVVTLGTPHAGTPAALLGVLFLGWASRAVWQMLPGSPLLRELARLPVPPRSEVIAVAAVGDTIVPARFARVAEQARQLNTLIHRASHWELLFSSSVFGLVGELLH